MADRSADDGRGQGSGMKEKPAPQPTREDFPVKTSAPITDTNLSRA